MQDEPEPTQPIPPYVPPARPGAPATSVVVTIGSGFWRNFLKWAAGILLVVVLGNLLLALNAAQVTAGEPAHKALRRAAAGLTEIDSLLVDGQAALQQQAAESPEGELALRYYPVDVPLSAREAELSTAELRDVLLDRSAERMYGEGIDAFRATGGDSTADIDLLSAPGAVRWTVGLLTDDTHDIMSTVTLVLGCAALVLAVALVLLSRGYGRLTSLGAAVSIATLPYLLVAVTLRFILRLAEEGEGDYMTAQLYELGKDVAWLPVRTGIAFAGLGVVFLVIGIAFSAVDARRRARA